MEDFNFDKFMDDIEKREQAKKRVLEDLQRDESASTHKELQKRYQETPANRIRYNK